MTQPSFVLRKYLQQSYIARMYVETIRTTFRKQSAPLCSHLLRLFLLSPDNKSPNDELISFDFLQVVYHSSTNTNNQCSLWVFLSVISFFYQELVIDNRSRALIPVVVSFIPRNTFRQCWFLFLSFSLSPYLPQPSKKFSQCSPDKEK